MTQFSAPTGSSIVRVFPGVGDDQNTSNGTFNSGDVVGAECQVIGPLVRSDPTVGERPRESNVWIKIVGAPGKIQYARLTYGYMNPADLQALPSCPAPDRGATGSATITAVYDVPDGCATTTTITVDLHGDPRAAGKALWIAAVLSAPPNVLYYPKMRITPHDGRFTVAIPANTEPGARTGRFGLIVSPSDQADADLQTSLQADQTRNDSLYPDTRRLHLQAGNVELATTPFSTQRC